MSDQRWNGPTPPPPPLDQTSAAPYVIVTLVTTGMLLVGVAAATYAVWVQYDEYFRIDGGCFGALMCGKAGLTSIWASGALIAAIALFGISRPWSGGAPRDWWRAFFPLVCSLGITLVTLLHLLSVVELTRMTEFTISLPWN